ncbi:MAG: hypothetical protein GXP62_07990 [Oligoflexia bacterium]|nr:hypothetical protein [Oligoflexia bacterium]
MLPFLLPALVALSCNGGKGGDVAISDVQLTLSDVIPTVATVTWTTSEAVPSAVRYQTASRDLETAWSSADTSHSVVLLGVKPDTEVSYQVVAQATDGSGDETITDADTYTTGNLPSGLPATLVDGEGQDRWMLTTLIGATTGPILMNPDGDITWAYVDKRGLDTYRARALRDGSGVIYNAASVSGDPADNSELVKVSWDGKTEESIALPLLAHDFVELSDGTLTAIVVEFRDDAKGQPIRGDSLVEIAPDGTQTTVWSAWDCFDPETTPGDEPKIGWTFVNALDVTDDESAYIISVRNFSSIVHIDRATGACDWAIGGDVGTISLDGATYHHEHQFELVGDRLLVFDNAGLAFNKSRALEFNVDWEAGVATEVWRYEPDPTINGFVLGDVARFDDGDTLITWSVAGEIDRVDANGVPKWTLNTELGFAFGFMSLKTDLYE